MIRDKGLNEDSNNGDRSRLIKEIGRLGVEKWEERQQARRERERENGQN